MARGTKLRAIRVEQELWDAAQARAAAENTTVSERIRRDLTRWVKRPPKTRRTPKK